MANISVVNDSGEVITKEIVTRKATLVPGDADEFSPSAVQRVEYDHKGQSSSVTTVCGETENRRESDELPDITVEGVITSDEIPKMKSLKKDDELKLISDIHSGETFVKRVTIEQTADVISFQPTGSEEEQLAFTFQLQLGQPEAQ